MKFKYALILSALLVIVSCSMILNIQREEDFNVAKRDIVLREIGHKILHYSGDSTSRVLPVARISGEKYQLRFGKQFAFEPDSLVEIIRQSVSSIEEKPDYIVNVKECSRSSVVFGYAVSNQEKNDIIPCIGRKQAAGCYLVSIQFRNANTGIKKYSTAGLLLAIAIVLPVSLLSYRKRRRIPAADRILPNQSVYIGAILFDEAARSLTTPTQHINLTIKESRLLSIFAKNPNENIDRSRLQKEIWEDEGIVVGRSLDVFISRLRKKLECDASVQLVNIHGKGYKLQITPIG